MSNETVSQGWNVMCNVSKIIIDVENRCGYLYLPKLNYPNMSSTIRHFTSVDPECNCIYTFVDGQPDTVYVRDDDVWFARQGGAQ
jgi:hypothetical protein